MSKFIQIGHKFFAVQHIAAIILDASCGLNGDHPAVSLYIDGNNDPWTFPHGSEEATALMDYARGNADCLCEPDYDIK